MAQKDWEEVVKHAEVGLGRITIQKKYEQLALSSIAVWDGDFIRAANIIRETRRTDFINSVQNNKPITRGVMPGDPHIEAKDGVDNQAITREKERIATQKNSHDYAREDHFAIGTVYLKIPPSSVHISHEKRSNRYNHLRSLGETIVSSGHSTIRIDLDVYFDGIDDINNKLRPLLAQFKTTPFLPIENELIRRAVDPIGIREDIVDEDTIKRMKAIDAEKQKYYNQISEIVSGLRVNKNIKDDLPQYYFLNAKNVPDNILDDEDYIHFDDGRKIPGYRKLINKNLEGSIDMYSLEDKLKDIDKLQVKIANLDREAVMLSDKNIIDRFSDEQIVGVLSQITLTTVDSHPETLGCRISMYVFNYKPFSNSFTFVNGYNPHSATRDITKCDLFVDWYTRRFLTERSNMALPCLSAIEGHDDSFIRYIHSIDVQDEKGVDRDNVFLNSHDILIGGDLVIRSIAVSFRNMIKFLPILSQDIPTCQYLGSYNTEVTIKFETNNNERVNELTDMVRRYDMAAANGNKGYRSMKNYIRFHNKILQLCGMNFFVINDYDVSTIPNNPGSFLMTLDMSEYNLLSEESQDLKRNPFVLDEEEIREAIIFMMDKAHLFSKSGKRESEEYKQYEKFYNLFMTPTKKWIPLMEVFTSSMKWFIDQPARDLAFSKETIKDSSVPRKGFWASMYGVFFDAASVGGGAILGPGYPIAQVGAAKPYRDKIQEAGQLANNIINSFKGDDGGELYNKYKWHIANIIMTNDRVVYDIKTMILNSVDNPELYSFLEENRMKVENAERSAGFRLRYFCYPDLYLPKYQDIKNGALFKNTFRDMGISPGEYDPLQSPQADFAEVDPDFFYHRESLWNNVDNSHEYYQNVESGVQEFMNIISNSQPMAAKSLDEPQMEALIQKDLGEYVSTLNIKHPYTVDPSAQSQDAEVITREMFPGEGREVIEMAMKAGVQFPRLSDLQKSGAKRHKPIKALLDENEIVGVEEGGWDTWGDTEMMAAARGEAIANYNTNASRILFNETTAGGYKRFHRSARSFIIGLARKIRESQKDDTLRMSRVFPTFKFYFVETHKPEHGMWSDPYEFGAIESIDIVRSRKEAADVAVVRFINTLGTISNRSYDYYDKDGRPIYETRKRPPKRSDYNINSEDQIESFLIKPGTDVQIRMGYSSDPDLLEVVFTGTVAEVEIGDIVTSVIQGHGRELLQTAGKPYFTVYHRSAYKILGKVLRSAPMPLRYFGGWGGVEDNPWTPVMSVRPIPTEEPGETTYRNWFRRMFRGLYDMFGVKQLDDNIYTPEISKLGEWSEGWKTRFITKDRAIWDVFQDMSRRMTGFVTQVLPFDYRSTIFFGPPDMVYRYTEMRRQKYRNFGLQEAYTKSDEHKLSVLNAKMGAEVASKDDIQKMMNVFARHMNGYIDSVSGKERRNRIKQARTIASAFSANIALRDARNLLSTSVIAELDPSNNEDRIRLNSAEFVLDILSSQDRREFSIGYVDGIGFKLDYVPSGYKDGIYIKTDDGGITPKDVLFEEEFEASRYNYEDLLGPEYKLFRNYHYKDSFHHIIANGITASEEYMANRVILGFTQDQTWWTTTVAGAFIKKLRKNSPQHKEIIVQADNNIFPHCILQKKVIEPNARSVGYAWQYGLSNLWLAMREMYQGTLTILGDPSIKPYDVIFIRDMYNDMSGPVEVESVNHHFSRETGFVTNIIPDLLCHLNNIQTKGLTVVADTWMSSLTRVALRLRRAVHWLTLVPFGGLGGGAETALFSLNRWSAGRREPIDFCPLYYRNAPFLAGVQGIGKENFLQFIQGRWDRMRTDSWAFTVNKWDRLSRRYRKIMERAGRRI